MAIILALFTHTQTQVDATAREAKKVKVRGLKAKSTVKCAPTVVRLCCQMYIESFLSATFIGLLVNSWHIILYRLIIGFVQSKSS